MDNRRLFLFFVITSVFAVGVLIWYFFFATPNKAPTLATPHNILDSIPTPRIQFITNYFTDSTTADNGTTTTEVTPPTLQVLTQIWDKPATGATFVNIPILKETTSTSTVSSSTQMTKKMVKATSTILLFVDRTTGYVYGNNTETGETYQISNTTLPGIYDAYIFNDGKRVLMRYLDNDRATILSVVANIPSVLNMGTPTSLSNITYLPKNVSSVAVSASSLKLSFLVAGSLGSNIYTITTKGQSLTSSSPFSEWNIFYGGEQLYANSKASAYIEGSTVLVPSFVKVVAEKTGLTSIVSSKGTTLNSMWSNSGLITFISSAGNTRVLDQKTLSSKCSEGKNGVFICAVPKEIPSEIEGLPDDWYQGRFSFDDSLFLIDPQTGYSYSFYSFDDKTKGLDVFHISSSKDTSLVSFINKKDSTLWLLRPNLITVD